MPLIKVLLGSKRRARNFLDISKIYARIEGAYVYSTCKCVFVVITSVSFHGISNKSFNTDCV